jgi:glyoxylase-like metal-dependent hydrolase (beta-lactamase superfamily II)
MKRAFWLATALVIVIGLIVGARSWSARRNGRVSARASAPHGPVGPIYSVARNLYVVPGGGGNTAVFVTSTGVVLVDTKYEDRYQAMVDQVRTVTDKPITHVINTHGHADHLGGNAWLGPDVEIIMQERIAASLLQRPGTRSSALLHPIRTFRDTLTLFGEEDQIELHHFGPAHTAGDLFVVFRSAGVMHAGDVFSGKAFPIINIEWGGNGVTFSQVLDRAASLRGIQRVIPGHGSVSTWQDLLTFRELNKLVFDHVRDGMKSGRDKNDVFQSFKLPARFAGYQTGRAFATMDEIDRSIRPPWLRILPAIVSRYW